MAVDTYAWTGSDEFVELKDRADLPPLPLPDVTTRRRITLVRHGQSTWNAAGRIQGSSNISKLTEKGIGQAKTTQAALTSEHFDALYYSSLERARHTAEIVWGNRQGPTTALPGLREVDLYSFQGLIKAQGKQLYGQQYAQWQKSPEQFEIDGHPPVRELWHRASLVWQQLLAAPADQQELLVVAHNAVNQALICTALGLPPSYFRRMVQSNGAASVLQLSPSSEKAGSSGGSPLVTLHKVNQSPGLPFKSDDASEGAKVALLHCGGRASASAAALRGAQVLAGLPVTVVLHTGSHSGHQLAQQLAAACGAAAAVADAASVQEDAEQLWTSAVAAATGSSRTAVVVTEGALHGILMRAALGMGAAQHGMFRVAQMDARGEMPRLPCTVAIGRWTFTESASRASSNLFLWSSFVHGHRYLHGKDPEPGAAIPSVLAEMQQLLLQYEMA